VKHREASGLPIMESNYFDPTKINLLEDDWVGLKQRYPAHSPENLPKGLKEEKSVTPARPVNFFGQGPTPQ
jgi:hypothetical protein